MTNRLLIIGSLATLVLASAASADEGFKYRKLKLADPPCLFLLDENTGQPTGNPVNPPCELGGTVVNPGDNVNPGLRAKHGKAADAASGLSTGKRQHGTRDAASGLSTGKRQHAPRDAASGLATGKRQHSADSAPPSSNARKPVPPKPPRKPGPNEPAKPPGQD